MAMAKAVSAAVCSTHSSGPHSSTSQISSLSARSTVPGHLLHFTEQLFRVGSQDRAHPQFLYLFDSGSEISLGAIDEP